MAQLLIRIVDGENALRYMTGDVVAVHNDDHIFGRMESLEVWLAEGRNAEDWPGGFAIVRLPGMSVEDAAQYQDAAYLFDNPETNHMVQRRVWTLDHMTLERRSAGGGRDTLRTHHHITRNPNDADVPAAFRRKGDA